MHIQMNETIIGTKNSLTTKKWLKWAATSPAAVCKWLQRLPPYFDVTPKRNCNFKNYFTSISNQNLTVKGVVVSMLLSLNDDCSHILYVLH